jgi:ArsR family transcriptional regulator, virulence genes transcriptional regulator
MSKQTKAVASYSQEQLKHATALMRALAHPLRLKIIRTIDAGKSACVNEIYTALSIEQSIASQHLRILRQVSLVHTKREGKFVHYSLNYEKMLEASKIAKKFADLLDAVPKDQD